MQEDSRDGVLKVMKKDSDKNMSLKKFVEVKTAVKENLFYSVAACLYIYLLPVTHTHARARTKTRHDIKEGWSAKVGGCARFTG